MKIALEGFAELERHLAALPAAVAAESVGRALIEGGEILRAEMARQIPRADVPHAFRPAKSGAGGAKGRHGQMGASHAADHVVMALGATKQSLAVGPADDWWYTLFSERGTVHQPPQGKVRASFDAKARAAQARVTERLWASIRAAAGGTR